MLDLEPKPGQGGPRIVVASLRSRAATQLVVVTANPYPSGEPRGVTVTARDEYGNTAISYRGRIHFTTSDTAALLPLDYTFTTQDAGVHTFGYTLSAPLEFRTTGTHWLRATDLAHSGINGIQTGIVVEPRPDRPPSGTFAP